MSVEDHPATAESPMHRAITDVMARRLTGTSTPARRGSWNCPTLARNPAYRQIMAVFAEPDHPLRTRSVCEAMELELELELERTVARRYRGILRTGAGPVGAPASAAGYAWMPV
ncbi:hypothetical protein A6P39_004155 [Streptomyces sp. FXJ1.172]|uniref:hypothetical protein n=1 Tax=Streptomyces sp. FXJ1.172 TaxID=710705 RepID=UPI0007D034A6|nr:hypothetical protein [Streptomyces sp. FXJ1.172]WEO93289.1 hypothetical protein A6P39_004155 [Streptomyces sp. FXJ1.172]